MADVNTGVQNKPNGSGGRTLLDYSLIACFTLVVLLAILVLDAFEYIHIPGKEGVKVGINGGIGAAKSMMDNQSNEELAALQKEIDDAKARLEAKKKEVEKIVNKVEDEIKEEEKKEEAAAAAVEDPAPEPATMTPEEKRAEQEKKDAVVKAVVGEQLGIDRFCGGCQYGGMGFSCAKRVSWMMDSYGLSEEVAIESVLHKCHTRLRRGRAF